MNPKHFKKVTELFEALRRLPPAERTAFLDDVAADDGELTAELESLLHHHVSAERSLGESTNERDFAAGEEHGDEAEPPGPRHLGDFRIVREIGRGGMGVVYEAEQLSLSRRVALKVLPMAAVLDPRQLKRFKNEAQAAALLHHQNIVPVHGVGSARGVHYYAMQYIDGRTVDEAIRERRRLEGLGEPSEDGTSSALLSSFSSAVSSAATRRSGDSDKESEIAARRSSDTSRNGRAYFRSIAELGVQVAEALDHAHSEGILHRDIKPSNLILDPAGKVWVTDFGLARMESQQGLTMTGDLLGTLRYMSPEQALAKRVVIDHRTDIYSLGVTLYELLTLRPAYPGDDRQELIRKITFEEPRPPRRWNKAIPVDLETIVLKAIAKNPPERFSTAKELADDLRLFLDDKPIQAKRANVVKRITKWSYRHKWPVAAAAAVLVLAVAGLAFSNFLIVQQRDAAHKRLVRLTVTNGMRHLDAGDLLSSLPWFVETLRLDHADPARERLHRMRIRSTLSQCPKLVWMWFHEGTVSHRTGSLDLLASTNAEFSPDGRYVVAPSGERKARVWDTTTGEVVHVLEHSLPVIHACFSRDGRRIATATGDLGGGTGGSALVWDAGSGRRITPPLTHERGVRRVRFNPAGDRVVTASMDGTARVWGADTGEPITPPMSHDGWVYSASFSPDGGRVVTASAGGGRGGIWDPVTGEQMYRLGEGRSAEFSPDGDRVVIGGEIWETSTGRMLASLSKDVWHATFSPDGRWVVTTSTNKTVAAQIWDAATFDPVGPPMKHRSGVAHAAFSPDSRHLVTSMWDRTARVWDTATGRPITLPLKHGGDVMCSNFSPDGRQIVTASTRLLVRVWDLSHLRAAWRPLSQASAVNSARFSPDGRRVVTASAGGSARVWDVATAKPISPPLEHRESIRYAVFSPDGRRVLTASDDGSARVWNAASGEPISPPLTHGSHPVLHASFSPDGDRLASAGSDGTARVWNVLTGAAISTLSHAAAVSVAWFSPDGNRVLTASDDATARIWAASTARPIVPPLEHRSALTHASWSPDGRRVLTTSFDGTARVWDAATGHPISPPLWHGQAVVEAAFSPNGRRVVTASNDNTAQVWDAVSGEPLTPPLGWQPGNPMRPSFSLDGRRIVTVSLEAARLWDAATGAPLTGLLNHRGAVLDAEFSPDGRLLLTASGDGTARLWDLLPDDRPIEDLRLLAQVLCGHRIDASGGSLVPVEPRALRDMWRSLRERYPDGFVPSPHEILTWHRQEAEACEQLEQWGDAVRHLETALRLSSDASDSSETRESLARLNRQRAAAEEQQRRAAEGTSEDAELR